MRFDFAAVSDDQTYASIPEGIYPVSIGEVRPGLSRDGSPRWSLRLDVEGGEYAGRMACFDNLTWSDRGVVRVKLVLDALGFDVSGTLEIEPDELLGRRARVEVVRETWEDSAATRQTRNTVPYRGWMAAEGEDGQAAAAPFQPGPQEAPF